jgi:hypothetical protein
MDRLFNFVRSDLFLSLIGGFAIGVAGLAMIAPASANHVRVDTAQSISIGNLPYETAPHKF